MNKDLEFAYIKNIISDCICQTLTLINGKIGERQLNCLANEYSDKILELQKKEVSKNEKK